MEEAMCQVSVSTVTILTLEYVWTENYRHGTVIRIDELLKYSSLVRSYSIHLVLIIVLIHIRNGVVIYLTLISIFTPVSFSRTCTLEIRNKTEHISSIILTRI